jgi:hypothetical protein
MAFDDGHKKSVLYDQKNCLACKLDVHLKETNMKKQHTKSYLKSPNLITFFRLWRDFYIPYL